MINIVIITIFYLNIIRKLQEFALFAYYSHILHVNLKLIMVG